MVLGKIINCLPPRPNKILIWRDTWGSPYISPWGILERFKLVNYAVSQDIFKVFGINEANIHIHERFYRNLIDHKGLSHDKLISVFGADIFENTKWLIKHFIAPLNEGKFNPRFIRRHIAYCPECLKGAYHSIFHQFAVLDRCPFHENMLKHQCSHCGHVMPYELSRDTKNKPFHCKCGASLSGTIVSVEYDKIWPQNYDFQNVCEEIRCWLSINIDDIDRLKNIIISSEPWVETKGRGVLSVALSCIAAPLLEKFEEGRPRFVISRITIFSQPVLPVTAWLQKRLNFLKSENISNTTIQDKIIKVMSLELYVYLALFQSYKSIIRHLKKTYLRGHIACIKGYISKKYTVKACIHAVAYVRWRQEIECKSDPCKVDKGRQLQHGLNGHSIPSMFSILDNPLLFRVLSSNSCKQIIGNWEIIEKTHNLWPCVLQLINRVFCHFLLQRYNDWLNYVASTYPEDDSVATALYCPKLDIKYPVICTQLERISSKTIAAKYHWID